MKNTREKTIEQYVLYRMLYIRAYYTICIVMFFHEYLFARIISCVIFHANFFTRIFAYILFTRFLSCVLSHAYYFTRTFSPLFFHTNFSRLFIFFQTLYYECFESIPPCSPFSPKHLSRGHNLAHLNFRYRKK